jgi:hypothetical protein
MILNCNFEELQALRSGADLVLSGSGAPVEIGSGMVGTSADVEELIPLLDGSISVHSLSDLEAIAGAVGLISATLSRRLEEKVLELHPAHEEAVALYFDHAHSLVVLDRLARMAAEMRAIIELMTGEQPTAESASSVRFPD